MSRNRHGWPVDPDSVRVLVVDDDSEIQLLLRSVLSHFEHGNVEVARTCGQALDTLRERPAALVFLDINLAGGDNGLSLLETLAARPVRPFVVMMTHDSTAANFRRAMALGAGYFVVKPFTSAKIHAALEKFHGSHEVAPTAARGVRDGAAAGAVQATAER